MKEEWKDIIGYEGYYQISNLGRVKSLEREVKCAYNSKRLVKERIMKCNKDKDGYLLVLLAKESKNKYFKVHRLVGIHYIDNPDNLPQINHKDENKQNNTVDNLEWCTNKYNNNYGTKNDKSKRPIIQLSLDYKYICRYKSIVEASKKINKNHSHIVQCCKRQRKSAYGYIWRYENENK